MHAGLFFIGKLVLFVFACSGASFTWFDLCILMVEHPLPLEQMLSILSRLSGTMTLAIWIPGWGHQGLQTVPFGMMLTGGRTNAASLQLEGKE